MELRENTHLDQVDRFSFMPPMPLAPLLLLMPPLMLLLTGRESESARRFRRELEFDAWETSLFEGGGAEKCDAQRVTWRHIRANQASVHEGEKGT